MTGAVARTELNPFDVRPKCPALLVEKFDKGLVLPTSGIVPEFRRFFLQPWAMCLQMAVEAVSEVLYIA